MLGSGEEGVLTELPGGSLGSGKDLLEVILDNHLAGMIDLGDDRHLVDVSTHSFVIFLIIINH